MPPQCKVRMPISCCLRSPAPAKRTTAAPQYIAIHFTVGGTPVWITWGHLYGDTNGNAGVNAGDSTQTKGRAGQTTDGTNFRSDVNTDGTVNAGDSSIVKWARGHCVALTRERAKETN